MVVRVASRILSPDAYARAETRLLPQPGEFLVVPSEQGRVTFAIKGVEQEGDEPVLRVAVCEEDPEDPHFGRAIGSLFDEPGAQGSLLEEDVPEEELPAAGWARIDEDRMEWVVVERADGTLEDMGFVEWFEYMPLIRMGGRHWDESAKWRLAWRKPGETTGRAVVMGPDDYEGADLRQPYAVDLPDGPRELWHVGERAYHLTRERGALLF